MQDGEMVPSTLGQLQLHFTEPWLLGDCTTKADLQALCPLQVCFCLQIPLLSLFYVSYFCMQLGSL